MTLTLISGLIPFRIDPFKRIKTKTILHKKKEPLNSDSFLSGWQDSNLRPPGPKPGAMTGLRYTPL